MVQSYVILIIFENESRLFVFINFEKVGVERVGARIVHNIDQIQNVGAVVQGLQDHELAADLPTLVRLEYLDGDWLVSLSVDSFEHLAVVAAAQ